MATAECEHYLHVGVLKSGCSFAPSNQQEGTLQANQTLFSSPPGCLFCILKTNNLPNNCNKRFWRSRNVDLGSAAARKRDVMAAIVYNLILTAANSGGDK